MREQRPFDPNRPGRDADLDQTKRELLRTRRLLERSERELALVRASTRSLSPASPPPPSPAPPPPEAPPLNALRWGPRLRRAIGLLGRLGVDLGLPTPFVKGAVRFLLAPRVVQGWLDEPAEEDLTLPAGALLTLRGWLVARGARIVAVVVRMGDGPEHPLKHGVVRPDVVRALEGAPAADRSGFWGRVPTAELAAGQTTVAQVFAVLDDGERVPAFTFRLHVTSGAPERSGRHPLLHALLSTAGGVIGSDLASRTELIWQRLLREYHGDSARLERDLELALQPARRRANDGPAPTAERLRILVVTSVFPSYEHGGGLTMFDVISQLSERHEVDLYSSFEPPRDSRSLELLRPGLRAIGLCPPGVPDRGAIERWLAEQGRRAHSYDVIHFFYPASAHLIPPLRPFAARQVFTLQECTARRSAIDIEFALTLAPERIGRAAYTLIENLLAERAALAETHHSIAYVEDDARFAEQVMGVRPTVIPIGVSEHAVLRPLAARGPDRDRVMVPDSVMFLGFYGHTPNLDAMDWYLDGVHERVRREIPGYQLAVVGSGDLSSLRRRTAGDPSIDLVGKVDEIVDPLLRAKVCIAPLVTGAGIRGKLNQYAAAGRPMVTTSLANNGLPYRDGESILIADEPDAFAAHIVALLRDEGLWHRIRDAAAQVEVAHFRWPSLLARYETLYRS
jgi:glycosyltransferase involved in cell wall biosynthesis